MHALLGLFFCVCGIYSCVCECEYLCRFGGWRMVSDVLLYYSLPFFSQNLKLGWWPANTTDPLSVSHSAGFVGSRVRLSLDVYRVLGFRLMPSRLPRKYSYSLGRLPSPCAFSYFPALLCGHSTSAPSSLPFFFTCHLEYAVALWSQVFFSRVCWWALRPLPNTFQHP